MLQLSIVIVNYRGWNSLAKCLASIQVLDKLNVSFETIVIDNCSDDGVLPEFVNRFPSVRFESNTGNHGFAHGCNAGATLASGKFLLFLNPDTVVNADALQELLACAMEPDEKVIWSCSQYGLNGKDMRPFGEFLSPVTMFGLPRAIYRKLRGGWPVAVSSGRRVMLPDWVSGSVVLISRSFFQALGGWEESFWMYYEDMDLCRRAWSAGGEVRFLPEVRLLHEHGGSSRINPVVRALTKSEVITSRHVYISRHFVGSSGNLMHAILLGSNLLTGPLLSAMAGMLLFFNPAMRMRSVLYGHLVRYYLGVLKRRTWISHRSVLCRR